MCKEHIRTRRRVPDRALAARRAARPPSTPLALYRTLRRINPSPYLFLLELDGVALVGSSPETHVKLEGTRASAQPDRRHDGPRRGRRRAAALVREGPRRARDARRPRPQRPLARLPRRARVKVERFLEPERFSHVTHLVSEVAGELRDGVTPFDLLRATFPAGTVSGAPKVRAMQIISELEGYRRGPYAGVVGYHVPGVALDTCIAIRTVVLRDGRRATSRRAAGIVADSDPAAEHEECLNKLAALEAAIDLAEGRDDAPADRQLRLVHVQPRAPLRGARSGGRRPAQRRDHGGRGGGARAVAPRRLPRPRPARGRGRRRRDRARVRRAACRCSASASATRRSSQAFGGEVGAGAGARPRQGDDVVTTTAAASSPACRTTSSPAATTRSPRPRSRTCFEVSATAADGEVMAVRHRELPVDGVQFHPESVLTPLGRDIAQELPGGRA